jgi:hypothetical protein
MKKKSDNKPPIIEKKPQKSSKDGNEDTGLQYGIFWGNWRSIKPTAQYLLALAKELVKWVEDDEEAFRIYKFLRLKKIPTNTYYRWKSSNEDLSDAHDFANMVIAERRERGAILRKYDTGAAFALLAKIDPEWKEMLEWKASLNKPDVNKTGSITVEMLDFPGSPLVPAKQSE